MENKAKIYIMGAAAVLVSGVKLEDWKRVEKYAPEALEIADEKGEAAFRIATASGTGSANKYGIVWGSYTSDEGYATVTILLDEDVENKKEAVMDVTGEALLNLTEIEREIPVILEKISAKETEIESYIEVI